MDGKVINKIREIQRNEGHTACFCTMINCLYKDKCCWQSICGIHTNHKIEVKK